MSNPGYCNKSWSDQMAEGNQKDRKANKDRSRSGSTGSRENANIRKRVKKNSGSSDPDVKIKKAPRKPLELETDPDILQRRQKQIDYGRNTTGYFNYRQHVPVNERTKDDPKTPDKYSKYSRRSWDMLIKIWRKKLHEYDTETDQAKTEDISDQGGTDQENSE